MAGVLCLLFFAAGAPSPLYGIYRAELRFSATTLTAVFAIYALVLLLTLLVFGSVSDYLGRRRVILAALAVTAGACAVFLAAHSVGLLFAARALQGLAVGTATGALGAALIDLQPEGSGLAPLITTAAPALGLGQARSGPARWPSTGRRRPAWCGGCCSAPAWPPPPGYWRCPSPGPGARRPGLAPAPGGRAAPGARDLRRRGAVPDRGVGALGPVPVTRAVAGRSGDPLAGPAVGRPADLPAHRGRGRGHGRVPRRSPRARRCWPAAWSCWPASR